MICRTTCRTTLRIKRDINIAIFRDLVQITNAGSEVTFQLVLT